MTPNFLTGIVAALVAFVDEHKPCGELDGGLDSGYVWLACSCGAQVVQPISATSARHGTDVAS